MKQSYAMRRSGNTVRTNIIQVHDGAATRRRDLLAAEEPLELRLTEWASGRALTHTVAVTMRTPGNDFELAAGFLFAEGLLRGKDDIATIRFCTDPDVDGEQQYNIVTLEHRTGVPFDAAKLNRTFMTTSSCGVCGKASLDALEISCPVPLPAGPVVAPELLYQLPQALHAAQEVFARTGGLHAAALFDTSGRLIDAREDVGRHNAVDKLIGAQLLAGQLPLHDRLMLVSGRTSYEIMTKALGAGIAFVAAVSAPSSLAVELARRFNMTLVGFLRERRCTIYAGAQRVAIETPVGAEHR
jgi:FdhD protein